MLNKSDISKSNEGICFIYHRNPILDRCALYIDHIMNSKLCLKSLLLQLHTSDISNKHQEIEKTKILLDSWKILQSLSETYQLILFSNHCN